MLIYFPFHHSLLFLFIVCNDYLLILYLHIHSIMSTCTHLFLDFHTHFVTPLFFIFHSSFFILFFYYYNNSSEKSSYEKYCHIGSSLVCFLGQQFEEKIEPVERGRGVARRNSDVVWPRIMRKMWNMNSMPTNSISRSDQHRPIITATHRRHGELLRNPLTHPIRTKIDVLKT